MVVFGLLVVGTGLELRRTTKALNGEGRELAKLRSTPGATELDRRAIDILEQDTQFMAVIARCLLCYLLIRLILGLFGHDLYEIYWWIAAGGSIAIVNMKAFAVRQRLRLSANIARDTHGG